MFIALGLLILVVSFVVALITLLREQKNAINTADTANVDIGKAKVSIENKTQKEVVVPQNVVVKNTLDESPQNNDNVSGEFSWKVASHSASDAESEQQKIQEIRAELARIAGEKISKQDDTKIVGDAENLGKSSSETQSIDVKNKLSGEISLRHFKGGE